ncbi:MAG: phosphoglycerate kinase [Candidatus Saccharimonadales bacterium]
MTFSKQTIRDVPLEHTTVLVRADYNVPLTTDGQIADDLRIRASIPTLQYLLDRGCKVVVMSHLGRPEGRDKTLSLEVVGERLAQLLQRPVHFIDDCIGDRVHQVVKRAPRGSVVLLENLRFYKEEEADDHEFAKKIAKATAARYFVQDGFGVVHRAHASTHAITLYIPGVAGLLLEREYDIITHAMSEPKRPLVAVMGGAKVSDKIEIIERFISVADTVLIGGAMANTFLANKGIKMGKSKVEPDQSSVIQAIYKAAADKVGADQLEEFIMLPADVAVAPDLTGKQDRRVVSVSDIADDELALDIGDQTIERYCQVIAGAGTVIWNGPVGYSTLPAFAHGSARIAMELATHPGITSIIGGGDTAEFVLKWDGHDGQSFTHVSTGGGAGLELMAGEKLPGVESLLDGRK